MFPRTLLSLAIIALAAFSPAQVLASATDGTISSSDKLAKGVDSNVGYFNFGTAEGDVHVTDSGLTGYAWSAKYGWINLAPTGYGVQNDGEGNLSGYAWGSDTGWINFHASASGAQVTIDENGDFAGYAWAQNVGWIIFNCATDSSCGTTSFKVSTDWRPASVRNAVPEDEGSSGGSVSTPPSTPVTPPTAPPSDNPVPPTTPSETPSQPSEPGATPGEASAPGESGAGEGAPGSGGSEGGGGSDSGIGGLFKDAASQIRDSYEFLSTTASAVAEQTRAIVESPAGSAVTKTVSTIGVLGGGIVTASSLFLNPLSFSEIFLIPFRLWAILMATLGLKKRKLPWGTVYDSVTKQPLDPAYVVLQDMKGNEINASITDLDGRYGFLLTPGTYTIVANKTNYVFPSTKLAGRDHDELYRDLYFGEPIEVSAAGAIVTKNIPLDPQNFDWNEFTKGNRKIMLFYSKRDRIMKKVSDVMFMIGFAVAVVALLVAPQPYNIGIFALYVVLLVLRTLGLKTKPAGTVTEKESGIPLSFAIVRIFSLDLGRELFSRVTDKFGRFYALVPPGRYTVSVERKNPDESYTEIFKSDVLEAKKGVIDGSFAV